MARLRVSALLCGAFLMTACATTQEPVSPIPGPLPPQAEDPVPAETAPPVDATPAPVSPLPQSEGLPDTVVDVPPADLGAAVEPIEPEASLDRPDPFAAVAGWQEADLAPALAAFRRSCDRLLRRPATRPLLSARPDLGLHSDWQPACRAATRADHARPFFESLFIPMARSDEDGLLTGYYETELDVRAEPDETYSEPILSRPASDAVRTLPRAELSAESAPVIAYGKPIDVFFLHVQGSGRLHFPDGRSLRAGYAANNGKAYKSIGRVLIDRGEIDRDKVSKAALERWMDEAGPEAARALMNENPRYIFFAERDIAADEGPIGAMQVPLTAMASVAVDPKHMPYGVPVWLETRLPQRAGDHRGAAAQRLVVAQDTGSAIRGTLRGDLYFGAGREAGSRAGVMNHRAHWTVLVPRTLAERLSKADAAS